MKLDFKRFLVLSEYVHKEQNSTGYYWSQLIDILGNKYDETILVSPDIYKNSGFKKIDSVIHYTFKFYKTKSLSTIPRALSQLSQQLGFFKYLIKNVNKKTIVFTGTNPPLLLILIAIVKKFKNFKWILLVHDVFPENFVSSGILNQNGIIYKIAKSAFDWAYGQSDQLIVIGRDMKELINVKTNNSAPVDVISNWAIKNEVVPTSKKDNELVKSLGWQNKIVFTFFGNIGRLQGIDNLLKAIDKVTAENAAFLFLGGGHKAHLLEKYIIQNPYKNICYLGQIDDKNKSIGLNACDVSLVSLGEGMLGLGVPSKSYFSMAAGKPLLIIADQLSEISMLVNEVGIGWECEPGNPEKLAFLIDVICNERLYERTNDVRMYFENNFTESIILKKFENVFERLIDH
jgi:glycosyltransferase involved in cell wall biosynthesis